MSESGKTGKTGNPGKTGESREIRLKRLSLRAMRRGTKEMDLVLGKYARDRLAGMDSATLDHFERFMEEGDNDLWSWITGQVSPPSHYRALIADIRIHAGLDDFA